MTRSSTLLPLGAALLLCGCAAADAARYPSPEAATTALAEAVRLDSVEQLDELFGASGADLVSSGDSVADRDQRKAFLALYETGHTIEREGGSATLIVGPADWPFPVPIVQAEDGSWFFDSEAGSDEIINRRIGRNELATIETCRAIVDAQREYAAMSWPGKAQGEYARRFLSSGGAAAAGGRDGLYWPTVADEPPSPLGELVADAQAEGYTAPDQQSVQPYHGYVYRMLSAQGDHAPGGRASYLAEERMTGGFAVLAYPVDYGNSGLMSFLVNANGVVFECDLGDETAAVAAAMSEFDPDPRWAVCE